jgi:hypothetical protein
VPCAPRRSAELVQHPLHDFDGTPDTGTHGGTHRRKRLPAAGRSTRAKHTLRTFAFAGQECGDGDRFAFAASDIRHQDDRHPAAAQRSGYQVHGSKGELIESSGDDRVSRGTNSLVRTCVVDIRAATPMSRLLG